jgi:Domain of unknown function (DUF929)
MSRRLFRVATTGACVTAIGVVLYWVDSGVHSAAGQSLGPLEQPVSADLLERLREVSWTSLSEMPELQSGPLSAIADERPLPAGPPLVLYVGADFCPYCAVLRWPLALALMRFGDLSGLLYTRSSSSDVFPDTATFSYRAAKFDSEYLRFEAVELTDRDQQALQRPNDAQRETFLLFNGRGSIPFLYLGGRFAEVGSPFSPAPLQGLDWEQIVQRLEEREGELSKDIIGEADTLTAALCTLTHQQPEAVCTATAIEAAAARLPR